MTLAVAQTDVGDAPFWVTEKRDVVHLASFRLHLKAHKKLLAGVPWHSAASQSGGQRHQATAINPPTAPTAPMVRHMQHGPRPSPHRGRGSRNRPFVWRHLHFPQMPATFVLSHTRARRKPSARDAVPSAGQGRGSLRAAQPHGRHRTKLPSVHPPCVPVWKLHFHPVSRAFTQDGRGFTCQHLVHAFRAVRGLCPQRDMAQWAPGFSHFKQGEALKPKIRQSLQTRRLHHCKCRRRPFFCHAA